MGDEALDDPSAFVHVLARFQPLLTKTDQWLYTFLGCGGFSNSPNSSSRHNYVEYYLLMSSKRARQRLHFPFKFFLIYPLARAACFHFSFSLQPSLPRFPLYKAMPNSDSPLVDNIHIITNLDEHGASKFLGEIQKPYRQETPFASILTLYANSSLPPNVTEEEDITLTKKVREEGLPNGRVTVDGGVASSIVELKPNSADVSPMHRTRTLDFGVVIEGEVDLVLGDGEVQHLRQGDTILQRGTMHSWKNVTPSSGWARLFFVSLDARPIHVAGKVLEEEWIM